MDLYNTELVKTILEYSKEKLLKSNNEKLLLLWRYLLFLRRATNLLDIQNTKSLNFQWNDKLTLIFTLCFTNEKPVECKYHRDENKIEVLDRGGENEIYRAEP